MLTRRLPAPRIAPGTHKTAKRDRDLATVPADRVKEMLLEIAFVLHASRVVAKRDEEGAGEKG